LQWRGLGFSEGYQEFIEQAYYPAVNILAAILCMKTDNLERITFSGIPSGSSCIGKNCIFTLIVKHGIINLEVK